MREHSSLYERIMNFVFLVQVTWDHIPVFPKKNTENCFPHTSEYWVSLSERITNTVFSSYKWLLREHFNLSQRWMENYFVKFVNLYFCKFNLISVCLYNQVIIFMKINLSKLNKYTRIVFYLKCLSIYLWPYQWCNC